jgi:YfiH family protein
MSLQRFRSRLLADVNHGMFGRDGGVSQAPYNSLNCSIDIGDRESDVLENHRRIREAMQIDQLVFSKQVHGTTIVEADPLADRPECDGLMTDRPGLGLMIQHADCQPVLLYDPVRRAIAAIHCGWRGNVQNVLKYAVEAMTRRYCSRPENLLAAIGPSLGPDWGELRDYKELLPSELWQFQVRPTYFDLWAMSRWQLECCGLLPQNIEILGICTRSSQDLCFSYRRDKVTGRLGTVIAL